jgi:hypothetical protein
MSLLELTVVVLVLLSLTALLFWGGQAWRNGSDRATCIINIHSVQKGVRSLSNLYGFAPGDTVAGLEGRLIGSGLFIEATPRCPGTGAYTLGGDQIPPVGQLYMTCSLAATGHVPQDFSDW